MFEDVYLTSRIFSYLPLAQLFRVQVICPQWKKWIQDHGNDPLLWRQHYLNLLSLKSLALPETTFINVRSSENNEREVGFWRRKVIEINGLLRRPIEQRVTVDTMIALSDLHSLLPRSGHGIARVPYDDESDAVVLINGATFNYEPTQAFDVMYFQTNPALRNTGTLDDISSDKSSQVSPTPDSIHYPTISYQSGSNNRVQPVNHQWRYCGWQEIAVTVGSSVYVYGGNSGRNIMSVQSRLNSYGAMVFTTHELGIIPPTLCREAIVNGSVGSRSKILSNHPFIEACSFTLDPYEEYTMIIGNADGEDEEYDTISAEYKYNRFLVFGGKTRRLPPNMDDDELEDDDLMPMKNTLYEARVVPDLQAVVWIELTTTGEIPSPRHCHSVVPIDRELYLFGGWVVQTSSFGFGSQFSNEMFILDIDELIWRKISRNRVPGISGGNMVELPSWPSPRCQASLMPIHLRKRDPSSGIYRYHKDDACKANEDKEYLLLFGGACHNGDVSLDEIKFLRSVTDFLFFPVGWRAYFCTLWNGCGRFI